MTETKGRTYNTILLVMARLSNIVIAIALSATLSRIIPDKTLYGALQQLLMIYSMLSVIFAAGVPQSVFYFLPRYHGGERKGLLCQNVTLLFLQGSLLGIILFAARSWAGSTFNSPHLPDLLSAFAIYPALMLPTLSAEGALMTYGRVSTFMIFSVISRLAIFLSLAIPVSLGIPLFNAILIWDLSAFVLLIITLRLVLSPVWREKMVWNFVMLKEEMKYSLPLAGAAFLSCAIVFTDKVVISGILGAAAYAVYANGAIELPLIGAVTGSVQSVLMAEFSSRAKDGLPPEMLEIWHRAVLKTAIVLLPFWGFLFFWAKEFIVLLFSQRYEASSQIFSIYVWMTPVKIFAFSSILLPLGASVLFTEITLVNAVMAVITIPVLATHFGMPGAASGTILIYWLVFFYGSLRCSSLLKTGIGNFLPWKNLAVVAMSALLAGALSRAGGQMINIETFVSQPETAAFFNLAIGTAIFVALYMSMLETTHLFSVLRYGTQMFRKVSRITKSHI